MARLSPARSTAQVTNVLPPLGSRSNYAAIELVDLPDVIMLDERAPGFDALMDALSASADSPIQLGEAI
jgi:hypothetical protein